MVVEKINKNELCNNKSLVLLKNREVKMKKFLKRILKGLGICVLGLIICAIVNIILSCIYALCPLVWWILVILLILFCGYQVAND